MEFEELKAAAAQCEGLPGRKARNIVAMLSPGGAFLSKYAPALQQATTLDEFFENIYADDDLRFEYAWALIAKADHDDCLTRFTPLAVYEGVPTEGGRVKFTGIDDSPDFSVQVDGADTACVYVFDDGAVNTKALETMGQCFGCFEVAGQTIDGDFDVYRKGNDIVIMMLSPETLEARRPTTCCGR